MTLCSGCIRTEIGSLRHCKTGGLNTNPEMKQLWFRRVHQKQSMKMREHQESHQVLLVYWGGLADVALEHQLICLNVQVLLSNKGCFCFLFPHRKQLSHSEFN